MTVLALWLAMAGCDKTPTRSAIEFFVWNSSTPEAQGMSSQVPDSAFVQARDLGFVDGLLVIRNGCIVGEKYYNEYASNADVSPDGSYIVFSSFSLKAGDGKMHRLTRREFLKLGASSAAFLGAPPILTSCKGKTSEPADITAPAKINATVAAIQKHQRRFFALGSCLHAWRPI